MAKKDFGCGDSECGMSSCNGDSVTFGKGQLNSNGCWEFPCAACEQHWKFLYPSKVWEEWEVQKKHEKAHIIEISVQPQKVDTSSI